MGRTSKAPLQLQEALIQLIWTKCYSAVTIDAICEAANVKKGSFYHFYDSKSALAVDAFDHHWETESRPFLDQAFSASRPPNERFQALLQADFEIAASQKEELGQILGCPFCNIGQEISTLEPEVAAKINEMLDRFRGYLTSALRDAIAQGLTDISNPEETSLAIYNFLHGSFAQARIQNSLTPIQNLPENIGRLAGLELAPLELAIPA
ncbi:MAG: TetR/AcrR family transcriptional regulator [Verrucomicrobiota bacterium]